MPQQWARLAGSSVPLSEVKAELFKALAHPARVRVLEANFYGPLLRGEGARKDQRWAQVLADDYTGVYFHIGYLEALGRRLRRNYAWIFAVQVVSYWSKLSIHPEPIASLDQLWARAAVGP